MSPTLRSGSPAAQLMVVSETILCSSDHKDRTMRMESVIVVVDLVTVVVVVVVVILVDNSVSYASG